MLSRLLPPTLLAALAFVLLAASPVIGFLCLFPFAILKAVLPFEGWRRFFGQLTIAGAQVWVQLNRLVYRSFYSVDWQLELPKNLDPTKSYLLICNHQSWIDIILLAELFHRRAPFPRFFLKRELLWVPAIGLGCWALDMPFMRRHTKDDVRRNPALKGRDLEATRESCAQFRDTPVTVVNFVEGTRFTETKRQAFGSPFRHLLRPKSAGLRVALGAMGDQFDGILDVTIAYRPTTHGIVWSFLRGEQNRLCVTAELLPIPGDLLERAEDDGPEYRARFQAWVNQRWIEKDARLSRLRDAFLSAGA